MDKKREKLNKLFCGEGGYLKKITAVIVLFSLTIVIAATGIFFVGTNDIVRKEIYNVNIGILSQLEMYVDMYLADSLNTTIKDNFIEISENKELNEFFDTSSCSMGAYYTLVNYVSDIKAGNAYMDSLYLYSVKNDAAVSSREGLIKDAMLSGYSNISKIQERIKNTKQRSFWITPAENANGMITFVQLIPAMDYEKRSGFVAININAETVVKTVSDKFIKSGDIAVISPDGELLAHSDRKRLLAGSLGLGKEENILNEPSGTVTSSIDQKEYDVIWLKSQNSGLGYVLLFPEQAYNGRIRILQVYCLIVMLGMLLITFIGSKYLSILVTNPIRKNTAFLEEKLVYDIIHENSCEDADIKNRLNILNTDFRYKRFYLIIFEVSLLAFYDCGLEERKNISERAIDIIKEGFKKEGNGICARESLSQISVVFNTNTDQSKVEDICRYILGKLKMECEISFNVSVSGAVDKARYVGSMYENVRKALEYGYIFGYDRVFNLEAVKKWESGFGSISVKQQKDMEGMLRSGDIKSFAEQTEAVFETIRSGGCSITTSKGMLLQIVSVIFRVGTDKNLFDSEDNASVMFSYADKIKSIDEYSIWIGVLLEHFKDTSEDKESNGQRHFISRVESYITENISNDISLNSVAEAMNISPNYLSKIFKEETGESFSGFVQDKKLERAAELLLTTKYSVSEISKMAGYANEAYFSKLFKSRYSTTPGQYRKNNK